MHSATRFSHPLQRLTSIERKPYCVYVEELEMILYELLDPYKTVTGIYYDEQIS